MSLSGLSGIANVGEFCPYQKTQEKLEKRNYRISEIIQVEVNKHIIKGNQASLIDFIGLGAYDWFDFWQEEFFGQDPTLQKEINWNNLKIKINQGPERNITIVPKIKNITGTALSGSYASGYYIQFP